MKTPFSRAFALWLPLVAVLTGLFVFTFWAVQQNYRQGMDDPQIQVAEDGAARLDAGGVPAELVTRGTEPTDIATSLAPWLVVYDASGTPLESSATLEGTPPHLPQGVFDTKSWKKTSAEWGIALTVPSEETRFTWQPRPGMRQAVVVVHATNGYFVAAGRNMRETEDRTKVLTEGAALIWGATALGTLLLLFILISFGWL
jgi:energy-converting hydrogenase Eha subunit F